MDRARAAATVPGGTGSRLPAAAGRLLRSDRLASPHYETRGKRLALCAVLHLRAAALSRQDAASIRPGMANPRARTSLPRAGGDQRHRLDRVGRKHRRDLVRGRRRGAAAHGRRRVRRLGRRHLGSERALVRGAAGRRECASEHARLPEGPLRRRRRAASRARHGVRHRHRPGNDRPFPLPGAAPGLVRGRGFLERSQPLRERLVAGALRRRPPLRRCRCFARRHAATR